MAPDWANNQFMHTLFRECRCTRTLFSSRSKYSTASCEDITSQNSERNLLSCLRIARKLRERNLLESADAEVENK
jgi:hypothetical protein